MANSVHQDRQGPVWPLGSIVVAAAGTPVNIMSVVDATNVNAPETVSGTTSAEYPPRAQQILFQAYKVGAQPPAFARNAGDIYILKKGAGGGTGNKTDSGTVIAILEPGQTLTLASAPLNRNVYNPYEYFIDADNSADACQVTLIIM